jgi:type I restriction-modification system DNA methylase subunit
LNPGTERKSTGSYYTRPELVHELIKSALEPVIEERIKGVNSQGEKIKALLALKVCDPAAGSGHFLLELLVVLLRNWQK